MSQMRRNRHTRDFVNGTSLIERGESPSVCIRSIPFSGFVKEGTTAGVAFGSIPAAHIPVVRDERQKLYFSLLNIAAFLLSHTQGCLGLQEPQYFGHARAT